MLKIVTTADGSHTLFNPELNEHYHSVNGAILESSTVFINNGLVFSGLRNARIYEAGFGTGLNAWLTLIEAERRDIRVSYAASEKYPLTADIVSALNYTEGDQKEYSNFFKAIHGAEWGKKVEVTDRFTIEKKHTDILEEYPEGEYDIVYYDAFAPSKQPEMWGEGIITACCNLLVKGGIFVTYSVRGDLKRILKKSGFALELLPGPPGKREVLRAIKK